MLPKKFCFGEIDPLIIIAMFDLYHDTYCNINSLIQNLCYFLSCFLFASTLGSVSADHPSCNLLKLLARALDPSRLSASVPAVPVLCHIETTC